MSVIIRKPNLLTLSVLNAYKSYIPSISRGTLNLGKNKKAFRGLIIVLFTSCASILVRNP